MKPVFLLLFSFLFLNMSAQNSVLDKYVLEGLNKNLQLQKEDIAIEQQMLKLQEAKGKFSPEISFNTSYLLAFGGRTFDFPLGDLLNPVNATLNQLTGTSDFPANLDNLEEPFAPHNFLDSRIKLRYPIFNRIIQYNYRAQEQKLDLQEVKKMVYIQELKKEIKVAYYSYFKICAIEKTLENTENLLQDILDFNEKLVKHNKATNDVTVSIEYEIEKNRSALAQVYQQKASAGAYFNVLLDRNPDQNIEEDPEIRLLIEEELAKDAPDLENLMIQAGQDRSEITQLRKSAEINETIISLNEKRSLPTLNLELNGGVQGKVSEFSTDQAFATVGFGFNWLLYDGQQRKRKTEQSKLESQRIDVDEKILKQQITLEVINHYHAFNAVKSKVKTERAALRNAQKQFDIIKKKYENQQSLLIEYIDAQTKFANSMISVNIVEYDLLIQLAKLERTLNI